MTTADMLDVYSCEVCFGDLISNDARLLSCHHSFCMNCLRKIMKNGSISCPTCREVTTVPNNDIKSLKVNFILYKFRTEVDRIDLSKTLCQFCLTKNATLKCKECSQSICEECSEKHKTIKTFKDHKIYDKHKDGMITHVCIKCARPACAKCVMTEHFDHQAEIETFQQGVDSLYEQISKYKADIDEFIGYMKVWRDQDKKELINIKTEINKFEDIKAYHLEKTKQTQIVLQMLKNKQTEKEGMVEVCKAKDMECRKLKTLLHRTAKNVRDGNLNNVSDLKSQTEKLLVAVKQENIRPVDLEDEASLFHLGHEQDEIQPAGLKTEKSKTYRYLEMPLFDQTFSYPGTQQWQHPYNISPVDSDCVLISDWSKSHITCVYRSDKPHILIPTKYQGIRDACVYQNFLYSAYRNCITKRSFSKGAAGAEVMYRPKMDDIHSMLVVNESCVVLVSYEEQKIIEYNPTNNRTQKVLTVMEPIGINMVKRGANILYLVTCQGKKHRIKMYDNHWMKLLCFGRSGHLDGELSYPMSTTSTAEGILVADQGNNRISVFSFQGQFLRHILTSKDGIRYPAGLTFITPFLWVTSHSPGSVKSFKLCDL